MIHPAGSGTPTCTHERAVRAIQRSSAEYDINPTALGNWHRHNRPLFTERMQAQLGEGCRLEYTAGAGRPRMADYAADAEKPRELFTADGTDD